MNREQWIEYKRLTQHIPPFEDVLAEIERGESTELFSLYYYPLCFKVACDFFPTEPELGREAALPLYEHWLTNHHKSQHKKTTLFRHLARNFLTDFGEKNTHGPEIVYQSTEEEVDDFTPEDTWSSRPVPAQDFGGEYPYSGIDTNDPETLLIQKEEDEDQAILINALKDTLADAELAILDLVMAGWQSEDIEAHLGLTKGALKTSIWRIRETMKELGFGEQ